MPIAPHLAKKTEPVFISPRFQQAVALHVLKNNLKRTDVQVPLLLGIHGPSGEGKTFQCEYVLKKMGVKRFLISGGQLESHLSGEPARLIRTSYLQAGESIRGGECSLAAVLINDVDTGLGSVGESGHYTMNQQTMFGELMHLVDYPTAVEGKNTLRVPVIITGNDFSKLYGPLVRAGRMTAFQWLPTQEERAEIVCSIFKEFSQEECARLIQDLNDRLYDHLQGNGETLSVAFFAHLRATLLDEDLWAVVERGGLEKAVDNIIIGEEPDLSLGLHYERVLAKGLELARSGELINHLKTPRSDADERGTTRR
jgi:SpoVK/Ycf46/Vps4 family AAA+-type ATPase